MTKQGTILIVDDNELSRNILSGMLREFQLDPVSAASVGEAVRLETENIDVVLLDMNFSSGINNGNEGIFWLGEIRKISNDLPVVLFTLMQTSNWP